MSKMSDKKNPIRDFMQKHYTDARLSELLAHAQDGKLSYWSCCCFAGASDANHALQFSERSNRWEEHSAPIFLGDKAKSSIAYGALLPRNLEPKWLDKKSTDSVRRRILIPMIRAEMWRRAKLRNASMAATPEATHEPAAEQEHTEKVSQ